MLAPPPMITMISGKILASVPQFPLCEMGMLGVGLFLSPGEFTLLKCVEKCLLHCLLPCSSSLPNASSGWSLSIRQHSASS